MRRDPTDDEMAAIMAAVDALWPRAAVPAEPEPEGSRWRFSGRTWGLPLTARRDRPWIPPSR